MVTVMYMKYFLRTSINVIDCPDLISLILSLFLSPFATFSSIIVLILVGPAIWWQEAINLLPEVAGPEIHPKIAQVLLERQRADVALSILRCSGRDGGLSNINTDNDFPQHEFLGEAITAVRVRIECGLLTEAFMFQRMQCSKAKDKNLKYKLDIGFSNSSNTEFWIYLTEVLVTEICHLCIRRNLVDRMIEFPWNSDEEKHLHKCLFDHGSQNPSSTCGSLLVVFYLQVISKFSQPIPFF